MNKRCGIKRKRKSVRGGVRENRENVRVDVRNVSRRERERVGRER